MSGDKILRGCRPRGEIEQWCRANWNAVPEKQRKACLAHLRNVLSIDEQRMMAMQFQRGLAIGSHRVRFHFDYGMFVRNELRSVLTDDKLPFVKQQDGSLVQNWDDFYTGALEELVEGVN